MVAEVSYTSGEKDFRAPLTKIKAANLDVIFIPAYYNDVALAAKQARELGIHQLLLGGDGWPCHREPDLPGRQRPGRLPVREPPGLRRHGRRPPCATEYKAKYSKNAELNSYMVHDALAMVVDAMQRAKSTDPAAIQKALCTTDLNLITGHIKIGPNHDPVGKEAWLIKIVDKDMKFQEKFATAL